jgi:ABC-type multidrug transport system fused ATPase/permease subunit
MPPHSRHAPPHERDDLPPAKITRQSLRDALNLFRYLLPYKVKFIVALIFLGLSSLMGLAFPFIAGNLVDSALAGYGLPSGAIVPTGVNGTASLLFLTLTAQAVFSFLQSFWFNEVGARALTDLRHDAYARIIRLPMVFHSQRRVGELSSRIAADLAQLQETLIGTVPQFLRQLATMTGGIALITFTSGRLTLAMLLSLPPLIAVAVVFGRWIRKTARDAQDRLADSNVIVEETLQGIASVKAYTNERYEQGRYYSALLAALTATLRGALHRGAFGAFVHFALFGAIVMLLWYGARMVQDGDLTLGELTRFMLYTMFVGGAMGSFAELFGQVQRTLGATQRVRELLSETPEVSVAPLRDGEAGKALKLAGDVRFDDVTFSYPSRKETQVLRGVSFHARAGERIALVGPSGAGKSTIVSLLLRFYDPDGGRLVIDGKDAREYELLELRRQIAIVPQDVLLFGGSIGDNIAYGRPGASQADIEEAAHKANAHDFISAFPLGYQTLVGERGIQLSGGQRQRVAIARAVLKNPAILILDEATSSLDSESESLVQQALETLMEQRTSVIIAHRLATVRTADRIFVVKDGTIVEAGTHDELLERDDGVYRNLSALQFDLH